MRDARTQIASHCAFRTPQRRGTTVAGGERQKRDRTLKADWMHSQHTDTPRQPAPNLSIKINALGMVFKTLSPMRYEQPHSA
jgi:hypothetical protein